MASEYNPSEIETIAQHVNKLTASPVFVQSERLVNFLRYVVGEVLKNGGKQVNQYVLIIELYPDLRIANAFLFLYKSASYSKIVMKSKC